MIVDKFANKKFGKNILADYPVSDKFYKSPIVHSSWFNNINYSPDDTLRRELNTKTTGKTIIKSDKIEVTFTPNQRNIILEWFSLYKTIYNISIDLANQYKVFNFIKLRGLVKPLYKDYEGRMKKFGIPVHTLDNAVSDVCKAYKSALQNFKAGNIKHFRLRPKRRCSNKETIVIEAQSFSKVKNSFGFKIFGEIKTSQPIIGYRKDTRLTFDKRKNKFYLFLVYDDNIKKHNSKLECSLDPGLRSFQTMYDKKNYIYFGNNTLETIKPILKKIDKVSNFSNKSWYKRYTGRLRDVIKNKVDDMHWQVSNFLVKRYNEITIGKLSTSIVSRTGNMSKINKRLYYALSHFRFRQRLQNKCLEYSVKYKEQNEAYTTKKCGKCGELNDVGASTRFNCQCGFSCSRDLNGARNIMIRKDMQV